MLDPSSIAAALEGSPDAIFVLESHVNINERRIIYANPAFEYLYECNFEEIRGTLATEFFRARTMPQEFEETSKALTDGHAFRRIRKCQRRDGRQV